jgi:hypothetical protein
MACTMWHLVHLGIGRPSSGCTQRHASEPRTSRVSIGLARLLQLRTMTPGYTCAWSHRGSVGLWVSSGPASTQQTASGHKRSRDREPATHAVQSAGVEMPVRPEKVPASHAIGRMVPRGQYEPGGHAMATVVTAVGQYEPVSEETRTLIVQRRCERLEVASVRRYPLDRPADKLMTTGVEGQTSRGPLQHMRWGYLPRWHVTASGRPAG